MTRYAAHDPQLLLRAARYAQLPDVRRATAVERFGISLGALRRAIQELGVSGRPRLSDYVLHALTRGGAVTEGPLPDLASLAGYLDYVNKDGSRPEDVQVLLDALARCGTLELGATSWRLLREFP